MGVVIKYGGTSVATPEHIKAVANYIATIHDQEPVVVVVSAMGKTTNQLIELANQVSRNIPKRELDALLAIGEQQTTALLTMALHDNNLHATSLTGAQAGFITTDSHTKGVIIDLDITRVRALLDQQHVVVVAGFQGMTKQGDITTLGRGGSDTSAVALAAKLGYRCEIYTDVSGIHTVDPRRYPQARKLEQITYTECMEMSSRGAGIIETRAIELAKKYNVELYIGKSLSTKGSGTMITQDNYLFEAKPITGIAITDHVVMVTVEGIDMNKPIVSTIFELLSEAQINLDMISQTIDNNNHIVISFSIDYLDLQDFNLVVKTNPDLFDSLQVDTQTDLVKLSLIGVGMASSLGVASKVFSILSKQQIQYYHVSTSEISISCTIDKTRINDAIHGLSEAFSL